MYRRKKTKEDKGFIGNGINNKKKVNNEVKYF